MGEWGLSMSTVDEQSKQYEVRVRSLLRKIVKIRREAVDESEFGRLCAPIVDQFVHDNSMMVSCKRGVWTHEEEAVLRDAYASFGPAKAVEEAAKKLRRTNQQIRSKAANMGIKGRW